jgi:uncharacterized protein YndB with AHSA1/START domain/predicted enzyme related to lactoylglutathione lyase
MPDPVVHFEVMVSAAELDAVRRFYADAFGWTIDANNPMNYGLVDNGGRGIGGGIGQPMEGGPTYATFYVHVEDLSQALKKIESLGGSMLMPPMEVPGQGISIAMFKDPGGNIIGLVTGPPPPPPPLSERELVLTRVLEAPREVVFRAWTDAKKLPEWWGPHGMTTPVCEMDPRPGGIFKTVMRDPSGTEYPNQGVFLEVVVPERIVFTDAYEPGWVPSLEPFMTAVVTFEEQPGGKTKLTARALHRSVGDRKRHEEMGFHQGWGEMLDRLAAAIAKTR